MGQTFNQMGWQDRTVRVNTKELLSVLRTNREEHIRQYNDACKGYRSAALKRITEMFEDVKGQVDRLKEGETIAVVGLHFSLNVPVSHEKAYDQIIRMMEMSVDETIELTCSQFGCFVMDDWDWKEQWSASNAMYNRR